MLAVRWRYLAALPLICLFSVANADHNATANEKISDSIGHDLRGRKVLHVTVNSDLLQRLHPSPNDAPKLAEVPSVEEKCLNGGRWMPFLRVCECPVTFEGDRCEVHLCLNGGVLASDRKSCICGKFSGKHCEQPACVGGSLNELGKCECKENYFGRFCELFCVHGKLVDGQCVCYDGFEGVKCTRCNATYLGMYSGECAEAGRRRRPMMQSRFALSGLSLCLITIILLWISVVTRKEGVRKLRAACPLVCIGMMQESFRRRRTMIAASHFERMANERLLREQQRRLCEHRTVAVQSPREVQNRRSCGFHHISDVATEADLRLLANVSRQMFRRSRPSDLQPDETPPPDYCATPQEAPPTYEEATKEQGLDGVAK